MTRLSSIVLVFGLAAACASESSNASDPSTDDVSAALTNDGTVGPEHVIRNGFYSDVLFCTMMAPHHQHAIEMARIEVKSGTHPELVAMASRMIQSQMSEIEELTSIKNELKGDPSVPTKMSPHAMENAGVPMPQELLRGHDVDSAFLDGMLPHHSGAIETASVALRHSQNGRIVALARRIIDAQAKEVGEMIAMRNEWYPGLTHGFPHAP